MKIILSVIQIKENLKNVNAEKKQITFKNISKWFSQLFKKKENLKKYKYRKKKNVKFLNIQKYCN